MSWSAIAARLEIAPDGIGAPAAFLTRWRNVARHDLTTSDSETMPLAALLGMAEPEDLRRWNELGLGYADPRGAVWLREAIAGRHAGLDAEDVLCCAGVQEAVTCVARALVGPGDHAIVVVPIYEPSERAVTSLCATTGVSLRDGDGWRLDLDRIVAALRPDTKLILTNFPNSPTGAPIGPDTLTALVAMCRQRGLWLVNDEVYRQTCLDREKTPMVADLYERGVSINGLSKGFGLPGLRVGWAACRDRAVLARALAAKTMLSCCLAATSEVLAHVALRNEARIVRDRWAIGRRNHLRLQAMLGRVPHLFADEPLRNCAFVFPRYLGPDGASGFAARLAREAGILVMPSTIWHSPLADIPGDRLRIGLGHAESLSAIEALERYTLSPEGASAAA